MSDESGQQPPLLRVISGEATDAEIAAVLAVVMARSADSTGAESGAGTEAGTGTEAEGAQASTWADPYARHRSVRGVFVPGRHGWRTSYWPR